MSSNSKKVIGLTGGIGSGKSTVSKYLLTKGCSIVDADIIAREVVEKGAPALKEITQQFGNDVLLSDGSLNRKRLADIVFQDDEKLNQLNDIMHDKIRSVMLERFSLSQSKITVMDAPLLFENGLESLVDEVWVVDTPYELQMERVENRDGITKEEIKRRMDKQLDRDIRIAKADKVIENNGTLKDLYVQLDEYLMMLDNDLE